jgi:hemolysin D
MSLTSLLGNVRQDLTKTFSRSDEREFLPAALEVVETPASPASRLLGSVIVLFFLCATAWAFLGKVDIIATAQGHVTPAGDVKIIQPLDPGIVRAIHAQDGDHVRAGQLLIELDPTEAAADRDRLSSDLVQAQLDVARLTALKGAITGGALVFHAPSGAPADRVAEAKAAMQAQADKQAAKVADLTQQLAQKTAEGAGVAAEIAKIDATMPMLAEREQIHHDLVQQGFGTSLAYLEAQQQHTAAVHDRLVQGQREREVAAARSALERQRDGARSEYAADVFADLSKALERQNQLSQDLIKAKTKSSQTELRSPIDGVVEQLAVHTLRGVVSPAEHLMVVVPDSPQLMIKAQLANRDVGFVHAGQPVKVKIETFNFTKYGMLEGHVIDVSRDAIDADTRPGAQGRANLDQSPRAATTAYVVRIALARSAIPVDGNLEPLQPGMTVTTEIKTGDRTVMDYLLSPIARKSEESLHER